MSFIPTISSSLKSAYWNVSSRLKDRSFFPRSFSTRPGKLKVLLITEKDKICKSQIFPFYFYRAELNDLYDVEMREVRLNDFESMPDKAPQNADIVLLQTWFDISEDRLTRTVDYLKHKNRNAKFIFLDSFAPTDLRLAQWLGDKVDVYLKKHVLRDRSKYFNPTRGDTNLVDYYGRLYNLDYEEVYYPIPENFLDKLIVGPSFVTAPYMLPYFTLHNGPFSLPKKFDIHGRLAYKGSDWYGSMRKHSIEKMDSLKDISALSKTGVGKKQYFNELRSSKLCFSPFGYGEVCWRDYEAVLCGSLLIKPDMSHLETTPDIFVPHETYVPIEWDFSNFEEVVRYYLAHDSERERIVKLAYETLHDYCVNKVFVKQMEPIFST